MTELFNSMELESVVQKPLKELRDLKESSFNLEETLQRLKDSPLTKILENLQNETNSGD